MPNNDIFNDMHLASEYSKLNKCSLLDSACALGLDNLIKKIKSRKRKNSAILKHIYQYSQNYTKIYFATFTINDKSMDTTMRNKRQQIKRALAQYECSYILNPDYGDKTFRQHFHALIFSNSDIPSHTGCTLGMDLVKPVNLSDASTRVKKYMNKLVNHCIKDSAFSSRITYSDKLDFVKEEYWCWLYDQNIISSDILLDLLD